MYCAKRLPGSKKEESGAGSQEPEFRILRVLESLRFKPFIKSPFMAKITSENKIVLLLQNRYPAKSPLLKKGIGDDAAVMRLRKTNEYWSITTDMLLEGVDFRREWTSPRLLGRKSIAVNLSDLAAMGARPRFFTVSLAVPPDISESWILEFYEGLTSPDSAKGAQLIGGDLSHSKSGIAISITALGESLNRKVLYRSGGRAGDLLYVTGTLGKSGAGLKLLQKGKSHPRSGAQRDALHSHHSPEPRCETGVWLSQCGCVRCMMDLSDGLSMDLPRLCAASGTGAEIRLADLPIFTKSQEWGCDPVDLALHGGEDFELLFAVPASKNRLFEKIYPSAFPKATQIGEMTAAAGKILIAGPGKSRRRLPEHGYDHFR
jgi:thiamine-monophosphate kinase